MEEYLKCESHLTTTTWRSVEESMEMISGKKRKFDSELRNEDYCGCDVELVTENPVSPATSRTSGGSDKYEEHSNDVVKRGLSDLETEVFETGIPTSIDRIFIYGESFRRWRMRFKEKEREEEQFGFLKMSNVKLPESGAAFVDRSMGLDRCREMCRRNCSCRWFTVEGNWGEKKLVLMMMMWRLSWSKKNAT
ncbi:hypothetical protein CASFOL_018278 [Castilleja foliolosa]|uniref:Apple domain-containing protein n=1 Tax=Castilleja foliolosa TaxID=1961234 RepID=A0ABD3D6A5_9LAMI